MRGLRLKSPLKSDDTDASGQNLVDELTLSPAGECSPTCPMMVCYPISKRDPRRDDMAVKSLLLSEPGQKVFGRGTTVLAGATCLLPLSC